MQKDKQTFSEKYNGFVTKKGNFVWAGAISLAWNQLKNSIIKEPIKLATEQKPILKIIQNFNAQRFNQKDIDSKSVYIKSGYGPTTLQQINKQVKQKFPQKTFQPIQVQLQDDSIISYAYLFKKLSFIKKFQRLPDKNLSFNGKINVDAFYAQKKQHRKQIQMIDYINRDNFCIGIKSKDPKDVIFMIKRQKFITLEEAFNLCNQDKLNKIGDKDQFMMPVIDFDLSHHFNQLKLPVKNDKFCKYRIEQIFENIKLRVDQQGAKVENQGFIAMNRCMMIMPEQPKQFVLDKSFWLIMKQHGKHPYFAAFIENPIDQEK